METGVLIVGSWPVLKPRWLRAARDLLHRAPPFAEQIVTEEEMKQQIEERKANSPRRRAKREALVAAMELKDYESNAHGVDLGQFYESAAIVPDGSERPQPAGPSALLPSPLIPDSHLPHVWVGNATHKVSIVDLALYTTFRMITGYRGRGVGSRRQVTDIYCDWAQIRDIGEDGPLRVRLDEHTG